jgi:hypothetical protein
MDAVYLVVSELSYLWNVLSYALSFLSMTVSFGCGGLPDTRVSECLINPQRRDTRTNRVRPLSPFVVLVS